MLPVNDADFSFGLVSLGCPYMGKLQQMGKLNVELGKCISEKCVIQVFEFHHVILEESLEASVWSSVETLVACFKDGGY